MKQFCTILLSIIINTIVLIHVLVPHHHHGNLPCFKEDIEQSCCSHHENAGNSSHNTLDNTADNNDNNTREHHGCSGHQHADDGSCPLEQVLLLNHQDGKDEYQCDVCLHHHNNHLLQAILLASNYEFNISFEETEIKEPPYLIQYHSIDASLISGLRAPPTA